MGGIDLARDIRVFHTTLIVRRFRSFHFKCEVDGKINFNHIYL